MIPQNNDIIFSLNEEDLQTVALQEIDRKLSRTEIEQIKDAVAAHINWHDAIAYAIHEKVNA